MNRNYRARAVGLPWWLSGKESAFNVGDLGSIPGLGRSLEEGMATHSGIRAWRIPWTEQSDGLQSMDPKESHTTEQLSTVQHESPGAAAAAARAPEAHARKQERPLRREARTPPSESSPCCLS